MDETAAILLVWAVWRPLTRSNGRFSSAINCAMIDLVSRPEISPPTANVLDIAVDTSASGALDASWPLPDRASASERLEILGDALDLLRRNLADHLVCRRVHDLDAELLRL